MSRKRKNFHYHYAEQFETREQRLARRRSKRRFAVPPLALVFSIVLLAVFGLVSTTFSVYVTTSFDDPEMPAQGGLVVNIKNGVNTDHPESTGIVRNNGDDLADSGAGGTVTNQTVYYTPYHGNDGTGWIKDNVTTGARYLYGDGYWQSANGSDTGRTQGGQRVYSVIVQEKYGGLDQLYFRRTSLDSNTTNEQHAINGWSTTDNWSGKYYNGSSWGTYTADTYKVYNNGSALATLSFNSSTKKYTGSATLSAGTTYILNLYDGANYWANGGAGTLTATGSDTMYRYGSGGSGDGFSITPTVTGTYSFEWVLSTAGNREDTGTFKVTFPTTYTVTFNANGHGTAPASQTVVSGGKATEPTAPTASGYTFGGWYKESSCTNKWNFTSDTVTSNKTLYAKWTANQYCTMSVDASKSLTLGTATAVSFTTTNHSTGSVKITSGNSTYVQVCATQNGTYGTTATISNVSGSGTFYVKGLQPISTPVNVVVACNAGHSNAVSATCAVTVNTPTVTFDSLSVEELRSGTLSISARTPAPTSYSWSVDSTYSSLISLSNQTATSVKVTAAAYSQATAKVKYTATYSTGYSKTFEADVTITESVLKIKGSFDSWAEHKMTYDATASSTYNRSNLYSYTYTINSGATYSFVFDEGDNTIYKNGGTITSDRTNCAVENSSDTGIQLQFNTGNDCQITTTAKGSYTFYYDPSTHKCWISEYPGIEYYLVGFGDWDEDEDTVMTKVSSTQYTYTKNFAAAQPYAYNTNNGFKIAGNDGSWYGYTNTLSRTNTSVTMTKNGGNNAGFNSSYSGDYTFTFNPSTGALSVTFPTRSITVNAKLNTSDDILGSISNTSTSSSFFTITDNYNDTFTVTPKTNHTQYQFTKWRDNNSTTGARTITVNSSTAVTYDTNWNYKSYTITYKDIGNTTYSGSNASSLPVSYIYGSGVALVDGVKDGYTFGGWYTNSSCTGTPVTSVSSTDTGNKTFYAKWLVQVTFKDNIDGNQIGSVQSVAVGSTVTAPALNGTTIYTDLVDRGYEFTNTWSASLSNIQSSQTIYAIFKPAVQDFSISIIPNDRVTGTGEDDDPYILGFGAAIKVDAEIEDPTVDNGRIKYKWSLTNNGTYVDGVNGTTYVHDDITTMITTPSGTFTLYAMAYGTDYNGDEIWNSTITSTTIYYEVESPITGITLTPNQKIYSTAPQMALNLNAELYQYKDDEDDPDVVYSDGVTNFTNNYFSDLFYFDKSTNDYVTLSANNEIALDRSVPNFITTISAATFDSLRGVNYFRFAVKDTSGSEDRVDSYSEPVRTVVGTSQGNASRPLYVSTTAANSFVGQGLNRRVMLLYITDRGTLGYQTSTSFQHDATTDKEVYRFDIPSYVENVYIAVFDADEFYVLPKYESGSIIFEEEEDGDTVFDSHCIVHSNAISVDSDTQTLRVTGISGGVISAQAALLS